ncbi:MULTISPECIES: hypothetical protein [Kaistia]|jgi:hypothetical protein|uniref:Lipid-binding transport protein (Tim44 family) n=1 Tax=Kaistia defluvii TaxID=410841 RepID=A0ABV2QTI8_9HYPH
MSTRSASLSTSGAWLMALAALAGLAVSIANYFNRDSGIAGEPGTLLVIASTAIMLVAALILARASRLGGFLRGFLVIGCLVDIFGTGFAAYLLESQALLWLMVAGLVGWLLHVFGPARDLKAIPTS